MKKKFVTTKTVKGRTYQYFRKDGHYIRLPDDPNGEEFDKAYWRLMRGGGQTECRYTFDKLIASYKQSPRWEHLAPRTKSDYSRVLEYIKDSVGPKDPTKMRRVSVIAAQMANKHRARFANYIPHMLSILFEHAIDLDWQRDNPAKGIAKIKTGEGYEPWPDWAIEAYRKTATENDLLIMELAIGTGQRVSDILKMKWADIDGDGICVTQGKTKAELWIPFTDHLAKVIANTSRHSLFLIGDQIGRPIKLRTAQSRVQSIREKIGATKYQIHGWRYTAASELAAAGATDSEIAAITGHRSLEMVAKYSRKNNQRKLATSAQGKRKK